MVIETTTKDSYLACACAVDEMVCDQNFIVQPNECNYIDHLMPNQVDVYIKTDDGGEFTCSHKFTQTANDHRYNVTTTAVDLFYQTGIVKQLK